MNQKNIFSAIAVLMILQGVVFYFMGDQMMTQAFPNVVEPGHHELKLLFEVLSAFSIMVGFIAYACRNTPSTVWAFTAGFGVLVCVTAKHMFIDHVNVPIPAIVIQVLIFVVCAYLMSQKKA